MGAGGSSYDSVDAALAAGKSQAEIDAYLSQKPSDAATVVEDGAALLSHTTLVRLPETTGEGETLELQPFDRTVQGRAVPMLWYYVETVDTAKLMLSLRETLCLYVPPFLPSCVPSFLYLPSFLPSFLPPSFPSFHPLFRNPLPSFVPPFPSFFPSFLPSFIVRLISLLP
jgi:hypothetical protein